MTEQQKADGAGNDPIVASTKSTPPGFEPLIDPAADPSTEDRLLGETEEQRGISLYFIIGGTVILLLFIALTAFLYMLGGDDQSALERLRDIAVIYIVFMSVAMVLVLAAVTVAASWMLVPTIFALHYARLYYSAPATDRPLAFPQTPMPVYWDFAYFSFTISAAAQTADVCTRNTPIRRLVLVHTIIAFFFNASILGLAINVAAGLIAAN